MDPLVTTALLANRLKKAEADLAPATALDAVTQSSALVRAISGQTITLVEHDTVVLSGGERVLRLPQRPILVDQDHPLTVVELGDFGAPDLPAVEGRDFERLGEELRRGMPWYRPTRLMGWPWRYPHGVWAPRVQVTYSHGYAQVPDDVVKIVLDVAQVLYDNPMLLRSRSIDDYSETFAVEMLGRNFVETIRTQLQATGRGRRGAFSIQAG